MTTRDGGAGGDDTKTLVDHSSVPAHVRVRMNSGRIRNTRNSRADLRAQREESRPWPWFQPGPQGDCPLSPQRCRPPATRTPASTEAPVMPTMTPTRASARGASTAGTARKVGRGSTRGGGGLAGPPPRLPLRLSLITALSSRRASFPAQCSSKWILESLIF